MQAGKKESRGNLGIVVSVVLHVVFFAGCLFLDTTNLSSSHEKGSDVTQIQQVKNTSAMNVDKS